MADGQKKRPSGGKRAGDRRRAERAAEALRSADTTRSIADLLASIGEPPTDPRKAPDWILRAQLVLARAAMLDAGMTPTTQREQASRILANAAKSVDAAKLRAELAELYAAVNGGKVPDAAEEHRGDAGGSPPEASFQ